MFYNLLKAGHTLNPVDRYWSRERLKIPWALFSLGKRVCSSYMTRTERKRNTKYKQYFSVTWASSFTPPLLFAFSQKYAVGI